MDGLWGAKVNLQGLVGLLPSYRLAASAESVPLENASFDLVLCQQGLQFFPDRPAALREVRRLLSPRGRLLVSVWRDIGRGFEALASARGRHISAEAGEGLAKGPASLRDPAELSSLIEDAGFRDLKIARTALEVLWGGKSQSAEPGRTFALLQPLRDGGGRPGCYTRCYTSLCPSWMFLL